MTSITKNLILQIRKTRAILSYWKGRARSSIGYPYTNIKFKNHWRFKTPREAIISSNRIFAMYLDYRDEGDFIGYGYVRKISKMGFTRARRYANHNSGQNTKN